MTGRVGGGGARLGWGNGEQEPCHMWVKLVTEAPPTIVANVWSQGRTIIDPVLTAMPQWVHQQ